MFRRILAGLFILIGLSWIGYVAIDLVERKTDFNPTSIFGLEDSKLLIINRKSEVDPTVISFSTTAKNNEILQAILPFLEEKDQLIISAQRKNLLITSTSPWTTRRVKALFDRSGLTLQTKGIRTFQTMGLMVSFHKKRLYIRQSNLETTPVSGWDHFDHHSSATLVEFTSNKALVKDIYFRENNKIEFHSKHADQIKGRQISDEHLFSTILPRSIRNYHFIEQTYALSTDPIYAKSPMSQWVDNGLVSFEYKGKKVIVTDFKSGQDPIQLLYDVKQLQSEPTDHDFFERLRLTNEWNAEKSGDYFVYVVNDFVVISEDEATCIDILTQHKLGSTLATDRYTLAKLYSDLPTKVSERTVNWNAKFSKSIYRGLLLESHILVKPVDQTQESIAEEGTLTIQVDAKINDFISFDGKGNAAVLTATGELIYYVNGKTAWIKNLGGKAVGKLVYLEQFQFLVATCRNSIHVLDKQGNYVLGGTIPLSNSIPQTEATAIEWRNRLYFFYPDERGNLVIINSRRQIQGVISTALEKVNGPIEVWSNQNKLFAGIYNQRTFKMIDVERRSEYRSFAIPTNSLAIANSQQLGLFVNESAGLVYIDQKGNQLAITPPFSGKLYRSTGGRLQQFMLCSRLNRIHVYDASGFTLGQIACQSQSIESIDAFQIDGRTYVTVVDGIENNVYLHNVNGTSLTSKAIEGSQKAIINKKDNQLILTTIVDKYLVQYDISR